MSWNTMSLGVTVILLGALASVTPCDAADGNQLLRDCTTALRYIDNGYRGHTSTDAQDYGWCVGYLVGLVEGSEFASPIGQRTKDCWQLVPFCRPRDIPIEQVIRIVVKYLRETPETLHTARELLAAFALKRAFPCPPTTAPPQEPTSSGGQPPTTPKPSKGR